MPADSHDPSKIGRGLTELIIDPLSLQDMVEEQKLNAKQRIDLEKIRKSGHVHPYCYDEFRPWTGNNYIKSWYDVEIAPGVILPHMWPNAGKLSGKGQCFSVEDNVKVRLSMTSPF